jgi:hypothetical protein
LHEGGRGELSERGGKRAAERRRIEIRGKAGLVEVKPAVYRAIGQAGLPYGQQTGKQQDGRIEREKSSRRRREASAYRAYGGDWDQYSVLRADCRVVVMVVEVVMAKRIP